MWKKIGEPPERGSDAFLNPWSNVLQPIDLWIAAARPHLAEGHPLMRNTRPLLLLCALAVALAVAVVRPLPSRADSGDPQTPTPDPAPPSNAEPIVPQLPVVSLKVRKPASVVRR